MQIQFLIRCGFYLLRNFLLGTIALVNIFGLNLAFRLIQGQNTCFYHQVSEMFLGLWHDCRVASVIGAYLHMIPKTALFGLIRGLLPIFLQGSALFNQEIYTSSHLLSWQVQSLGCPDRPLVNGEENAFGLTHLLSNMSILCL